MRAFIDFEASSLNDEGYPIEVGWVFEDGRSEAHLIKPAAQWVDWDEEAEALHHISRAMLRNGMPHEAVARRLLDVLAEHTVYASAPSWDGKWLSALLRAAGLPRHALRLKDSDEAHFEAAAEALRPVVDPARLESLAADIIEQARTTIGQSPPHHRALDDARQEWQIWLEVKRLAQEAAAKHQTS
jgi:hypothetical protein